MNTCDHCHQPLGRNSVTAKRKSGAPVVICASCADSLRKKRAQKKRALSQGTTSAASESQPKQDNWYSTKDENDRWYKTLAYGIGLICVAVYFYYQFTLMESGGVNSVRVWWPMAFLYGFFGKWVAASLPALGGMILTYIGIRQFMER